MAGEAGILADGVTLAYRGVTAVRGLHLHVEPGEIVALLGANGAGKTTTLLGLSGVLAPVTGRICVAGDDRKLPPHRRARLGVAHVPENRGLHFGLTVRENLALARAPQPVERALELFPSLGGLLDRRAGLLSGGEQQMLALGRALCRRPKVLLVDEMSLGLAPTAIERLLRAIQATAAEGTAVLVVEQHIAVALALAHRAYVMRRGEVVLERGASDLSNDVDQLHASYLS